MQSNSAIIIGSGVAGLATAIRLSIHGYQVSVYEKNHFPGGKLHAFEKDGFHFDAGPSLFTQPENLLELFEYAGEPIGQYINWQRVNISCKYFFENGKQVDAFTDIGKLANELTQKLDEDPDKVKDYLNQSAKLYDDVGTLFVNKTLHKKSTWLNRSVLKAISTVKPAYLFQSLDTYNQSQFKSPEAVQLFNRFATYNGSNPYEAPSMLSLIPSLELGNGTYYPSGGMISITNALYKLAITKGITFHFNSPVNKILSSGKRVMGIVAGEKNIYADIIVSNADVYFTYLNLLQNKKEAAKVLTQERSSSAVIFYWGIAKKFPQLDLHNIFFSKDYQNEFHHIFNKGSLTDDPTIYINITSKMEPGQAPAGKENWFVMVNAPSNKGQDWKVQTQNLKINILKKLQRILGENIEALIQTETIVNPVDLESQTGSYMGSLYGTSSNSKLAAFFRHPNFSRSTKGLYFCGGSVHPGGGIPLCLHSAKIVSQLIQEDYK